MSAELPHEVLLQIFDYATDEDVIFNPYQPDALAQSAWFKNVFGDWALRVPQEALSLLQRRSYATKKAILTSCKQFRELGAEFLFRSLFFDSPSRLYSASYRLVQSAKRKKATKTGLGWWTRRIHLTRYYAPSDDAPSDALFMESSLISILECCPNLEIFIVDYPLGSSFGPVCSALATSAAKTLSTVHWSIPSSQLAKLICALSLLPSLVSVSVEFSSPQVASHDDEEDSIPLGAASDDISLPKLEQLLVKGELYDFVEQASDWNFPALKSFTVECVVQTIQQPEIVPFLRQHGLKLLFLAIDCIPELDIPLILALCPSLTTLAMNADWKLPLSPSGGTPRVVNHPHHNLRLLGLYGLGHAFGAGYGGAVSAVDPLRAAFMCHNNEGLIMTLAHLKLEGVLPKLTCVRALSRSLLAALERNDGPAPGDGMERWSRWYGTLSAAGIRFEDCTGNLLGDLPDDEEELSEEEEEEEEEQHAPPSNPKWQSSIVGTGMLGELRQLVEECKIMAAEREEGLFSEMAQSWPGFESEGGGPSTMSSLTA